MKEETSFNKKYLEFEGKFRTRQNIIEHFIAENIDLFYEEKDVEEILDKHFVTRKECEKEIFLAESGMVLDISNSHIKKQKVKDAIDKIKGQNYGWTNSRRFKEFEQELGLK